MVLRKADHLPQGSDGRKKRGIRNHVEQERELVLDRSQLEVKRLHGEIERLREEREILKKALAIFSGPRLG
jgi:hypothetical protein